MRFPSGKVITLCGSIRFKEDFEKEAERLTRIGYVVLMPAVWLHLAEDLDVMSEEHELKSLLMAIHRAKIDMASEVHIINKGGYIGKSTAEEIEYASRQGKEITLMEIGKEVYVDRTRLPKAGG